VCWWDAVQGAGGAAWSFPSSDRQCSTAPTRAGDVALRFGGKEFVDISSEMDAEKALCPAAEICQSVSDINHPLSEKGGQVGVTV